MEKNKSFWADWFKKKTLRFRHRIVKLIAPNLYKSSEILKSYEASLIATPRPMIEFIKQRFNCPLIGVEIGVAEGINAYSIVQTLPIKKLFLIDPYIPYIQDGKLFTEYVDSYEEAKLRLKPFSDKIVWILKTSDEAVSEIPDELDFVYIDGNHSYDYVKRDILNYFPKIKHGGVIGGHDFEPKYQGVRKAVLEFIHKHSHEIGEVYVEKSDWWVIKGEKGEIKGNV